ncbi:Prefoldin subunit-domain-containing protein [Gaertneriomyces semiglobifer]|nr:Prefoldin subunit-domain-containing protein [Gaertneriomyces semiglobifer]
MQLSLEREAQVRRYEDFVNHQLRVDLQNTLARRDKVFHTIAEYLKLRNQIELIKSQHVNELKTMMDIGCEFFMQAKIPDTSKVVINLGAGYHVEMTLDEAIQFINEKGKRLTEAAERHTDLASNIKANIKVVLTAIEEILLLEQTEQKVY